ncbi:long tail fiber distal subunit [Yersinia phage vB_YenM_TG1]|uniref:Long tail fiber distal subunit n=1 Tax=Yersinia phage vB_YenM_TG1 TaxID=1589265 RepID=A0A0B5A311_9CAUD|nr:long tail fiber protein distal subunit [Yersinia phage vB_YenM_TG1]AJD82060.1 long tail fiber distal subunit [Yersinia phage vB_YenM_TG1]
MADLSRIKFKRSSVAGKRPLPADIAEGELAINLKDCMLFTKDDQNMIVDLGFAKGGNVDGNINQVSGNFKTAGNVEGKNFDITDSAKINNSTKTKYLTISTNDEPTSNGIYRYWGSATRGSVHEFGFADSSYGMYVQKSPTGDVDAAINGKLSIGTAGNAILNIGGLDDGDTGFTSGGDGLLHVRANNEYVMQFQSSVATVHKILRPNAGIETSYKGYGTYDFISLAQWADTPETANGVNHLRKMRGCAAGTIFHELVDQKNSEIAWYQGNGPEIKIVSWNSDGDLKANGSITALNGSFFSRASNAAYNANYWFHGESGQERAVIYAGANGQLRLRNQATGSGEMVFDGGMIQTLTMVSGSERALIRGTVDGGSHVAWRDRSSGIQLDCPNSDNVAYNIWKATKWGANHLAAMDVHAPAGDPNNVVIRLLSGNHVHNWNGPNYSSPGTIAAGGRLSTGAGVYAAGRVEGHDLVSRGEIYGAGGNVTIDTSGNILASAWETGNLKHELNTIRTAANNAQSTANTANATANNAQSTANTANANANAAARWVNWGTSYNFGLLNQTPNQRIIDKGWFLVGLAGAGQNNNTINLIGGRIQVWNNNSGWVDSST